MSEPRPSLLSQLADIVALARIEAAKAVEQAEPLHEREVVQSDHTIAGNTSAENLLVQGDNLHVMASLLRGDATRPSLREKLDLVYIDPPFDSNADYHRRVHIGDDTVDDHATALAHEAYSDTWNDGTVSYLAMLTPRLILIHELLSKRGSLYVHLDWHVGHYVKVILDEIFGRERFRNEIAWCYASPGRSTKRFKPCHDTIYYYAKSASPTWTNPQQPLAEATLKVSSLQWQGQKSAWQRSRTTKDMVDWWEIQFHTGSSERLGFHTQKPEALIERILNASSHQGDMVADFFAGSGTMASVSERLGRRWISVEQSAGGTLLTRNRLLSQHAEPFITASTTSQMQNSGDANISVEIKNGRLHITLHAYAPDLSRIPRGSTIGNIMQADSLALVDQWSVGTDDEGPFRAIWRSCRSTLGRGRWTSVIRVADLALPGPSPATLSIRILDVFGLETVCTYNVLHPASAP